MKTTKVNVMREEKGYWDLNSKEFQLRSTLGKILLAESIESNIGIFIHELKKQYIMEECEFKVNDLVYFRKYKDEDMARCGKIKSITFEVSPIGFVFLIQPLNKSFTKPKKQISYIRVAEQRYKSIGLNMLQLAGRP